VLYIAFVLGPQQWSYDLFFAVATLNYGYKMLAAILMIPALYGARKLIHWYLGHEHAELLHRNAHSETL
jgi:uncharacterized PurR-regulated membrane protein YhhQ (DUF165 family)